MPGTGGASGGAVLVFDLNTGNELNDGLVTGDVSGSGSVFSAEVYLTGTTGSLSGVSIHLDVDTLKSSFPTSPAQLSSRRSDPVRSESY